MFKMVIFVILLFYINIANAKKIMVKFSYKTKESTQLFEIENPFENKSIPIKNINAVCNILLKKDDGKDYATVSCLTLINTKKTFEKSSYYETGTISDCSIENVSSYNVVYKSEKSKDPQKATISISCSYEK